MNGCVTVASDTIYIIILWGTGRWGSGVHVVYHDLLFLENCQITECGVWGAELFKGHVEESRVHIIIRYLAGAVQNACSMIHQSRLVGQTPVRQSASPPDLRHRESASRLPPCLDSKFKADRFIYIQLPGGRPVRGEWKPKKNLGRC